MLGTLSWDGREDYRVDEISLDVGFWIHLPVCSRLWIDSFVNKVYDQAS
jgi:hypothetical protein